MRHRWTAMAIALASLPASASAYELCLVAPLTAIVYVQVGTAAPRGFSVPDAACQNASELGEVKAGTTIGALRSCHFSIASTSGAKVTVHYAQAAPRFAGDPESERCLR